jgi:uncharacterized membrane protein YraQ (UPF0718 family)
LNIYRKYYGWRVAAILAGIFYVAMAFAGYAVELLFGALNLIPAQRHALVRMAHLSWNYTTFLNMAFAAFSLVLILRFATTGGLKMLRMMSMPASQDAPGATHSNDHTPTHHHGHH